MITTVVYKLVGKLDLIPSHIILKNQFEPTKHLAPHPP